MSPPVVSISYLTHVKDMTRAAWEMFSKLKTLFLSYSIFALSVTVNKQVTYGALFVTDFFPVEIS